MSGEEIRRFRDAVRSRIERATADTGRAVREIPPDALLSLLCASAFSAVAAAAGLGGVSAVASLGALPSVGGGVLGALVVSALNSVNGGRRGEPPPQKDLEREIFRRIQQVLSAGGEHAATLRAEIATVLQESDAMRSALLVAVETENDRLRRDVLAAIDTLSGRFAEMAFLIRTGDQEAVERQRPLVGQHVQSGRISEKVRRQSAYVPISREEAGLRPRQSLAGHGEADAGPRWADGCPYLGLLPFDQAHAEVFYGRQRLTTELMLKLAGRLTGPAMIIVSGASGAGKSSLVHAGLLPALAAGLQLEGSDRWPRMVMTPTGDPLSELAARLAALSGSDAAAIRRGLAADPGQAHVMIGRAVEADTARRTGARPPANDRPGRLVLVVDQFEEVFTLNPGHDDVGQQAFIGALCAAATQPFGPHGEPPALVVIAVRGDFWARCAAHARLARMMQDGMFVVGPMTEPELREAITGPADAARLQVGANLADVILADLRTVGHEHAEGMLPLLSQAMLLTWGKREGNRLTVHGYNQTGGVARAVESGAEAVYEALPDAGQYIAKEIFQALTLVGPDGQLARCPARRAELYACARGADRRSVDKVLEAFAGSRLLVLDGDTVQVAHDVLLRAWPRLRGWLDSDQANWLLYTQLQEDAAKWAEHGQDASFLYRGSQLAAVQQAASRWAADPARYPALTHDQSGFLAASRQHAARGTRLRRAGVLVLALLLLISVAGIGVAAKADLTADQQRNSAVSNQLAAESETLDATNPVTAASLAAAAWKIDPTAEAQTSLFDVLAQPERAAITAASGNVQALAFSPDGTRFATVTDADVAQIWDTATHREIGKSLTLPGTGVMGVDSILFDQDGTAITFHGGANGPGQFWNLTARRAIGPPFQIANNPIGGGIFSPDGKILAADAVNGDLSFLDTATHREIGAPVANLSPLSFSPDGRFLAVGVGNDAVQIMNVATQHLVGPLMSSSKNWIPDAVFSPDGKILVVNGQDSVSFWNLATGHTSGAPLSVTASGVAYSPNGKIVATISPNGAGATASTVNLWDAASHQELGGAVTVDATELLGFSPDGNTVITADGSTVNFWDVATSRQVGALIGGVAPVTFSPDGKILAAITLHGAGLWNIATHQELGRPVRVGPNDGAMDVAFSPDGKTLATGGYLGVGAQLWNVATHRRIGAPDRVGDGAVDAVAFSRGGRYLATGNDLGKTWLWNVETGDVIGRPMINGDTSVNAVAFTADGDTLATASNQVRLFSTSTHHQIGVPFATGTGTLNDMVFSPDGGTIATASDTGVVLWDVATQHQVGTALNVGVGPADSVAFSPDGMILAVGDVDGTIRLWDVASHEQIGSPLVVNNSGVYGVAFSPDGTLLAAASGATRLWGVDLTHDALNRVCAIAGGSMTRQEWTSYVKSERFQLTCTVSPG
jgi:WD40 repeat protein